MIWPEMADKGAHKKKTKGCKAAKRKVAVQKKSSGVSEKALTGTKPRKRLEPSKQRNPKAFTNSSSGRAKREQARSAEKSQRRLHGELQSDHNLSHTQLSAWLLNMPSSALSDICICSTVFSISTCLPLSGDIRWLVHTQPASAAADAQLLEQCRKSAWLQRSPHPWWCWCKGLQAWARLL